MKFVERNYLYSYAFYFAEVLHQSKSLPGSPFTCEAFDSSKVITQGVPKGVLALHNPICFTGRFENVCFLFLLSMTFNFLSPLVRTENAGLAELEAFAVSPTNQNLPVHISEQAEGVYNVELLPSQPGNYKLTLMYGGETLQGSPFNFSVSSNGSKSDRAAGNGLEVCHRNKETSFIVYCPIAPNVQIERIDEFGERIEPKIKVSSNFFLWLCDFIDFLFLYRPWAIMNGVFPIQYSRWVAMKYVPAVPIVAVYLVLPGTFPVWNPLRLYPLVAGALYWIMMDV